MIKKYYEKYLNIPIAARAATWFVICSLLQKCISFITVPIFTRLMPTKEYGLYSTYLSIYSILTVICTLSMEKCVYINNIAKAKNEKEKDDVAVPLLSLSEILTIICFIIYLIFHKQINDLLGLPTILMILLFVQILFEPPVIFWTVKQRYEYKYIALIVLTIGMVIINSGLGILFVLLSKKNQAVARVISIVLAQIVFGGICYFYFFKRAKKVFACKNWKHTLKVQIPLLPHSLSLTVLSSSDRIMINAILGASQAAIYSVAYSAGYVVNTLKNSISSAMTPWIYEKIKAREFDAIRELTKPVILLITVLTFLFISFAPEIIMIMAPTEYQEAVYVIPPVAASSFFTFLYNMFSNISFYYEETKKIMCASVIGAVLNLVLNAVCIPAFGYVAAGYTTLVCYIVFTFAHFYIMKGISKKYLNDVNIFDIKYIICLSIIVLIMTIVFSIVYAHIFIRYFLLGVIIIFIFLKRNMFISSLQSMKNVKK